MSQARSAGKEGCHVALHKGRHTAAITQAGPGLLALTVIDRHAGGQLALCPRFLVVFEQLISRRRSSG